VRFDTSLSRLPHRPRQLCQEIDTIIHGHLLGHPLLEKRAQPIGCVVLSMSKRFLGMIDRDPSVSKSNWLHVDVLLAYPYQIELY
jgi:hypothetical protein